MPRYIRFPSLGRLDFGRGDDPCKADWPYRSGMDRDLWPHNTNLRWSMTQGVWSFGASTISDFLTKTRQLSMKGIAGQIQCSCLVLEAEGDMFFRGQPQRIYDALQVPKQLFRFTSEDGAENHCQSGALSYFHEVAFSWLDETLKRHGDRKD